MDHCDLVSQNWLSGFIEMNQLPLFSNSNISSNLFDIPQVGAWADRFGEDLKISAQKNKISIKTLSLFSGAGGLDIGFHDAGFEITHMVELEEAFASSLSANTGTGKYFGSKGEVHCTDISNFDAKEINVDFIIGGPPCQSFSAAGARASGVAGTNDARGKLFQEYVRILNETKPKGFLFENVYRILGANKGEDWKKIVTAFSEVGYSLKFKILDAADYGVAQHRERLILVGIRDDLANDISYKFPAPTHGPDSIHQTPHFGASLAISTLNQPVLEHGLSGRYGHLLNDIPPGLNYSFYTEKMGHPNPVFAWRSKFSDFLYKADPEAPVRTIKAQGGQYTGPFHWDNRTFTIKELKRLQSFPDAYEICGTRQKIIHQIGNSVPPQFSRILAVSVLEKIFGFKSQYKFSYLNDGDELSFRKRNRKKTDEYSRKASKSIEKVANKEVNLFMFNQTYRAKLGEKFKYTKDDMGEFQVISELRDGIWKINVSRGDDTNLVRPLELKIRSRTEWSLPCTDILLSSSNGWLQDFLAMWKSLDHLLIATKSKADLTQLFGYYQYRTAAIIEKISLNFENLEKTVFDLIKAILFSDICGNPIHISELAKLIEADEEETFTALRVLKRFGYEIRSHNTNQSLEKNEVLVPYQFPTLTEKSVQLMKEI